MSEAPLDLQAVEAHLAELRELHRLPFSETAPRDAIDQARAIELGQALRLADVLLAELRSVRAVAAGAGDPPEDCPHHWIRGDEAGATALCTKCGQFIHIELPRGAGDRLRLGPAAPGPSAVGGAP
jgi:hypothetical protein